MTGYLWNESAKQAKQQVHINPGPHSCLYFHSLPCHFFLSETKNTCCFWGIRACDLFLMLSCSGTQPCHLGVRKESSAVCKLKWDQLGSYRGASHSNVWMEQWGLEVNFFYYSIWKTLKFQNLFLRNIIHFNPATWRCRIGPWDIRSSLRGRNTGGTVAWRREHQISWAL